MNIVSFQRFAQVVAGIDKMARAKSKSQQRFFGMVHAVQQGKMKAPSAEVASAAKSISKSDATDFAETKQKGLPEKKAAPTGVLAELIDRGYPDYGRSLVSQNKRDPQIAGAVRGAAGGATGAVLLALLMRMMTKDPKLVGGAALGGGLLGGGAGYLSGKREAESEHTKSLALRRLGINNPAELLVTQLTPSLTHRMVGAGGMSEVL